MSYKNWLPQTNHKQETIEGWPEQADHKQETTGGWLEQFYNPASGRESPNTAPAAPSPGGHIHSEGSFESQQSPNQSSGGYKSPIHSEGSFESQPNSNLDRRESIPNQADRRVSSDSPIQYLNQTPDSGGYNKSPINGRESLEPEPDFNPQDTMHDPNRYNHRYNLVERESFESTNRYIDPPLQDDTEPQDNTGLWIGLGVLGAGIGGLLWYTYYGKK